MAGDVRKNFPIIRKEIANCVQLLINAEQEKTASKLALMTALAQLEHDLDKLKAKRREYEAFIKDDNEDETKEGEE